MMYVQATRKCEDISYPTVNNFVLLFRIIYVSVKR